MGLLRRIEAAKGQHPDTRYTPQTIPKDQYRLYLEKVPLILEIRCRGIFTCPFIGKDPSEIPPSQATFCDICDNAPVDHKPKNPPENHQYIRWV